MRIKSVVSLLFFSKIVLGADKQPCTGEDDNGYYDLSPLRSNKDYEVPSDSGRTFKLNVCQKVKSELWNPQHVEKEDQIGGFVRAAHGDFSIGAYNTTVQIKHKHPLLIYENGSTCKSATNLKASSIIRFICDPAVFAVGSPVLVAQLPPEDENACAFFFEWRTHVACPTAKSVGAGGLFAVFAAILFAAFMTYIVGATLYNRYVLGYRGLDQLPTVSPLSSTAFTDCLYFIKDNFGPRNDGWVSSGHGTGQPRGFARGNGFGPTGGFGSNSGFSRQPPPPRRDGFRDEQERAPMIDQRFSIDDEEYERRTAAPEPPQVPSKPTSPRPNQSTPVVTRDQDGASGTVDPAGNITPPKSTLV
ncbi:autophagy-related protein 27 [Ceratobasidium sp. AG-Ba]|nr:autophagy-related protein 27 [Ceratobasidium sp. AG-Ba]